MHVISKAALLEFWKKHPESKAPLETWHKLARLGDFCDFHQLKTVFSSADTVGQFTVFDIGGNKYRLIAAIHYNRRRICIRNVLTHSQYDRDGRKAN